MRTLSADDIRGPSPNLLRPSWATSGGLSAWSSWPPSWPNGPGHPCPRRVATCYAQSGLSVLWQWGDRAAESPRQPRRRHAAPSRRCSTGAGGARYHRAGLDDPPRHYRLGTVGACSPSGPARPYHPGLHAGARAVGGAGPAGLGARPERERETGHPEAAANCRERKPAVADQCRGRPGRARRVPHNALRARLVHYGPPGGPWVSPRARPGVVLHHPPALGGSRLQGPLHVGRLHPRATTAWATPRLGQKPGPDTGVIPPAQLRCDPRRPRLRRGLRPRSLDRSP
jgi:hypothetical protein